MANKKRVSRAVRCRRLCARIEAEIIQQKLADEAKAK